MLRKGSRGEEVQELQHMLKGLGYDIDVDGSFGPKTKDIVEQFQRDFELEDDGIAGPITFNALSAAVDAKGMVDQAVQVQPSEKPEASADKAASPEAPESYVVQSGDTLSAIAKEVLGDASRYPEIMELNGIDDPTKLRAGQDLKLPDGAVAGLSDNVKSAAVDAGKVATEGVKDAAQQGKDSGGEVLKQEDLPELAAGLARISR